jgi:MoaA/NifB/PqqE/SkfB family radical SAM enzyme
MKPVRRMLKTLVLRFFLSPWDTMAEIGRRLLPARSSPQALSAEATTRESPLILQIETTNVCNARCAFCAYPGMKREKGVMSIPLFEKIVNDYGEMGGGPISLTPIMGDPLLDPFLLRRVRVLEENPKINQIALTTNAIALDKYSDDEVTYLLETLAVIQVSIGGLDSKTYRTMYGVDRFAQVKQAMSRLLELNETVSNPANIAFAFRTTDWKFERRFRREIKAYRNQGVQVSHLWTYSNYGGIVESDKDRGVVVNEGTARKSRPCALPCVHMAVCWDGTITACGCADAEGRGLILGRADRDSLADAWSGEKRARILSSFERGNLPEICRACSAYQQDTIFSNLGLKDIDRNHPLPMDFYHKFWGA